MSENPVAIVTGGSRGVGAATAKILSERGWNVIITCSSSIEEAKLVAKTCSSGISEVFAMQADVAKEKDCIATIDKAIEKWNRIDALINNAGTTKFVWDHSDLNGLDAEDFQKIYAVNVIGPFQMVQGAKQYLLKSNNPCVLNVSSIIRVNAICPGFIEGEWLQKGMGNEMYEAVKSRVQNTTPLKKTCTPESIAEVIFNLIETSELMTGELITVDGGASLNL